MNKFKDEVVWLLGATGAVDQSGNGNDATLTSVDTIADTGAGGVTAFDMPFHATINRLISLGDLDLEIPGPNATLSLWLKRYLHTDTVSGSGYERGGFGLTGSGALVSHHPYTNSIIYQGTFLEGRINAGTDDIVDRALWHHIAITRTNDAYKIYQDAVLFFEDTLPLGFGLPLDFRIGSIIYGGVSNKVNFRIDDIRLAPSEWSSTEITEVYDDGVGRGYHVPVTNTVTVGRQVETNNAVAVSASFRKTVSVGVATESNSASNISLTSIFSVGRANEISEPKSVGIAQALIVQCGVASENDMARTASINQPGIVNTGTALESTMARDVVITIGSGSIIQQYYHHMLAG